MTYTISREMLERTIDRLEHGHEHDKALRELRALDSVVEQHVSTADHLLDAAQTINALRAELAAIKAKAASAPCWEVIMNDRELMEQVEVVGYLNGSNLLTADAGRMFAAKYRNWFEPLMTVAQHKRIIADITANRDRQRPKEVSDESHDPHK